MLELVIAGLFAVTVTMVSFQRVASLPRFRAMTDSTWTRRPGFTG
ncbi:exported hypothetical protein [Burkholderiales bacterium]|jgi:hypothetical protein|nr:exported hypothetical protein [Burkholderiales bacterium]